MWAMAAGIVGYPLIWLGGKEVWGRPIAALMLAAAMFLPCLLLLAVAVVHYLSGRALTREGFRITWLTAQPPAPPVESTRWAN